MRFDFRPSRPALCSLLLVAFVLAAAPGTPAEELNRELLPNDVGIELLGKALLYSFTYQYTASSTFAVDLGFGALGGGAGGDSETILFFPVGAKLYLIPKDGSIYLGGGMVLVTGTTDSGPFDESTSYGYVGPGFEFRSDSGLLFRGSAYGLINDGGFFIWPGLTVGYAF